MFYRRVSSELKKDKQCVKQSVSRCDGPGRALLLRRFDNRISKLYDQFYRHCTPDACKYMKSRGNTKVPPSGHLVPK